MLVVIIEMWKDQTEGEKEKLIQGERKAFEAIGVAVEHLSIIHDVLKSNWGM